MINKARINKIVSKFYVKTQILIIIMIKIIKMMQKECIVNNNKKKMHNKKIFTKAICAF